MKLKVSFIFLSFFFLSINNIFSQETKKIEYEGNIMSYDKLKDEEFTKIIGNVIFIHEGMVMYCDSGYLYTEKNSLDAFSNIHIKVNDSVNIYGDSLRYEGNTKVAEIHNNVKLIDNEITLTTNHLIYYVSNKESQYYDRGKIVDPDNTLTSIKGYYFSEKKDFFFKDSVVLVNKDYTLYTDSLIYNTSTEEANFIGKSTLISKESTSTCKKGWYNTLKDYVILTRDAEIIDSNKILKGDSLFYDKKNGIGFGFRNVSITDTSNKTVVKGNYAQFYEKEGLSIVTDSALLIQYEEKDTLFLHSDTLKAIYDTATQKVKVLYAYNKTRFFRNNLQGVCDSLVYNYADSTIHLFVKPVLWASENQLFADTIKIQLANNEIDKLYLYKSSFAISIDDTTEKRFNQIKGIDMMAVFDSNLLHKIYVYNKAETIYFLREENGAKMGVNKAFSTDMVISVKNQEIESVTFLVKPEATLHPEKTLPPEDLFLKNFKWFSGKRPENKNDIYIWR